MLNIIKEGRRHRYIGFIIRPSNNNFHIKKAEMIHELELECQHLFKKNCSDMGIFLVRFDERYGIVKCNHIEKDNTIKLLKSINKLSSNIVDIETLGTSGTIKTLIKKHMTS